MTRSLCAAILMIAFLPFGYAVISPVQGTTVATFDRLDVKGPVDVRLTSGKRLKVDVAGSGVSQMIADHTLVLRALSIPLAKRPVVTVTLPRLTTLTVGGSALVLGRSFKSAGLSVQTSGFAKVRLVGMVNVTHINEQDNSDIWIRWVNSDALTINSADTSHIALAGTVKTLYARLKNHAVLNAEYLRAQDVQVQVTGEATAHVMPINTLRAFASEAGNIYYYKYPQHLTRSTSQSGNVLQMSWRP